MAFFSVIPPGVDRKGEELYQIMLGGSGGEDASRGELLGRGFPGDQIVEAVETVVDICLNERRDSEETFLETVRRIGTDPFKEVLYGNH